jgi:hypothetical protein
MTWDGMTLEEFGLQRFEVVKLCGGILHCRKHKLITRERELIARLAVEFPKLDAFAQREVLGNYPWVVEC